MDLQLCQDDRAEGEEFIGHPNPILDEAARFRGSIVRSEGLVTH